MAKLDNGFVVRRALAGLVLGSPERAMRAATELAAAGWWHDAIELSEPWRVTPQLATRTRDLGVHLSAVDEQLLSTKAGTAAARSTLVVRRGGEALETLDRAGIRAVAFKGVGIIAGLLKDPGRRMVSDVDILVEERDLSHACEVMEAAGCVRLPPPGGHLSVLSNVAVALIDPHGIEIDIHGHIRGEADDAFSVETILQRAEHPDLTGHPIPVAAPIDSILLTSDHSHRNGMVPTAAIKDLDDVRAWCDVATERFQVHDLADEAFATNRTIPLLAMLKILDGFNPDDRRRRHLLEVVTKGASGRQTRLADSLVRGFERQLASGSLDMWLLYELSLVRQPVRLMKRVADVIGRGFRRTTSLATEVERQETPWRRWLTREARLGRLRIYLSALRSQPFRGAPDRLLGWERVKRSVGDALRPLAFLVEPRRSAAPSTSLSLRLWDARAGLRKETRPTGHPDAVADINTNDGFYRHHLAESIIPFWLEHGLDKSHGGFLTHLDRKGRSFETSKIAVMQARMVYAFATASQLLGDQELLDIAREGAGFLIEHFWDRSSGGWHRAVTRAGDPLMSEKRLWDQSFVILALSEVSRVGGYRAPLEMAFETLELLDRHAWDQRSLGYYETCDSDWQLRSEKKTLCIQLDMLEALMSLQNHGEEASLNERVRLLADLICDQMSDVRHGCLIETCHPDWRYNPLATSDTILVGHNLKAAVILTHLYEKTSEPRYLDKARALTDYSIRHGWDDAFGGFFQFLYRNGSLARTTKHWWPQCEGIAALHALHRHTNDPRHLTILRALERFSFGHFVDHEFGEWFTACAPDGSIVDPTKGSHWKAAYHPARMCVVVEAGNRKPSHAASDLRQDAL